MSGEYIGRNDGQSGAAVATSEDISISKRGINGDKNTLLDDNGTLHQRKNITSCSDPEIGPALNQEQNLNDNNIIDNQGIHFKLMG